MMFWRKKARPVPIQAPVVDTQPAGKGTPLGTEEMVYMGMESAMCDPYLVAHLQEHGLIHRRGFKADKGGLLVMTPGTTTEEVWLKIGEWVDR